MQNLIAQITNPAVPVVNSVSGGNSGEIGASVFGKYLAVLLVTSITVGGLAVLLYLVLGAIQWITAGGDKGKIDKARERIIQAIIGLVILTSVTAIANFLGPVFGIDLLNLNFVNQITGTSSSGGRPGVSAVKGKLPGASGSLPGAKEKLPGTGLFESLPGKSE